MLEVGLAVPPRVEDAIAEYRQETDIFGAFLCDLTQKEDGNRLPTSVLYSYYMQWAKDNGYKPLNNKNFVGELRRRCDVRRDGKEGNVIVGLALSYDPNTIPGGFVPVD